jgi:hypothetical protein
VKAQAQGPGDEAFEKDYGGGLVMTRDLKLVLEDEDARLVKPDMF